jgi:hypothetical protein
LGWIEDRMRWRREARVWRAFIRNRSRGCSSSWKGVVIKGGSFFLALLK